MKSVKLYRAVSESELKDFQLFNFRCTPRTISGKQFFKSRKSVDDFVEKSDLRYYNPPYKHIIQLEIEEADLKRIP